MRLPAGDTVGHQIDSFACTSVRALARQHGCPVMMLRPARSLAEGSRNWTAKVSGPAPGFVMGHEALRIISLGSPPVAGTDHASHCVFGDEVRGMWKMTLSSPC